MIVFLILLLLLVVIPCLRWLPYYSPATKQQHYQSALHMDDTLRIAFIGDSWADWHKKHQCKIPVFISSKAECNVDVYISGILGLTSKQIYLSMFQDDSVRNAIEWGPDYCVVMAGINDADRKMGTGYYKENMRLIIDFLLSNQITPVIIEIPYFNTRRSFQIRNFEGKLQYLLSMAVHFSPIDCVHQYRKAHTELIEEEGWSQRIIYIPESNWAPEGYRDSRNLYDDLQMHLNEKGYEVLDSCIASSILRYKKN